MSSAYGIVRNYSQQYIAPYDTEQLMQIASFKQNTLDQNRKLVDTYVDQMTNLDLIKGIDRDYLNARLAKTMSNINSTGADLGSSTVVRNIQRHLLSAVDENVMEAINSTALVRRDMATIQASKDRNDKTYGLTNEAWTMAGVNEYMASNSLTTKYSKYNSRPYVNFIDVDAEVDKRVADLMNNRGETTIDTPMNDGRILTTKAKNLSPDQLRAYVLKTLTPNEQQQLMINGWYRYGQTGDQALSEAFTGYTTSKLTGLDADIGSYENKLPSLSGTEKDRALAQIQELKAERQRIVSTVENTTSSDGMKLFLESERLVEGLAYKYSMNPTSYTYSEDKAFFSWQNLQLAHRKDAREEIELGLKQQEFALKASNAQQQQDLLYAPTVTPTPPHGRTNAENNAALMAEFATSIQIQAENIIAELGKLDTTNLTTPNNPESLTKISKLISDNLDKVKQDTPGITDEEATIQALDMIVSDPNNAIYSVLPKNSTLVKQMQDYHTARVDYRAVEAFSYQLISDKVNSETVNWRVFENAITAGLGYGEASNLMYIPGLGKTAREFFAENPQLRDGRALEVHMKNNPEDAKAFTQALSVDKLIENIRTLTGQHAGAITRVAADGTIQIRMNAEKSGENTQTTRNRITSALVADMVRVQKNIGNSFNPSSFLRMEEDSQGHLVMTIRPTKNETVDTLVANRIRQSNYQRDMLSMMVDHSPIPTMLNSVQGLLEYTKAGERSILPGTNIYERYNSTLSSVFPDADLEAVHTEIAGKLPQNNGIVVTKKDNPYRQAQLVGLISAVTDADGKGVAVDENAPVLVTPSNTPQTVKLIQQVYKVNKGESVGYPVEREVPVNYVQHLFPQGTDLLRPSNTGFGAGAPIVRTSIPSYMKTGGNSNATDRLEDLGIRRETIAWGVGNDATQFLLEKGNFNMSEQEAAARGFTQQAWQEYTTLRDGIKSIIATPQRFSLDSSDSPRGKIQMSIYRGEDNAPLFTLDTGRASDDVAFKRAVAHCPNIGLTATLAILIEKMHRDEGAKELLLQMINTESK